MMTTQLSPTIVILPTQADAILLKIRGKRKEGRIRSQTLYPAELRAHSFTLFLSRSLFKLATAGNYSAFPLRRTLSC